MRSFIVLIGIVIVGCATSQPLVDDDSGVVDAGTSPDGGKKCTSPQTLCGAACADVTKDPNNCGACGTKCKVGQFCSSGKCSDGCNKPNVLCGQFCVDTTSDHENCGKCGMGCAADQECVGSACKKKCGTGLTLCDPDCVDTITDPNHCGDCNTACAMSEICTGSICCASGQTACMGQCTDLTNDANNCGQCGFTCGGNTPSCVNGNCTSFDPTSCASNPKWMPVNCTTGLWVWSSDKANAMTVPVASQKHLLWVGCMHGPVANTCSLTGSGWVSTQVFTMSGCNTNWYHLGGSYTGACGGHDGDQVRHLAMGANDCYNY
jgi:hypothetical protein